MYLLSVRNHRPFPFKRVSTSQPLDVWREGLPLIFSWPSLNDNDQWLVSDDIHTCDKNNPYICKKNISEWLGHMYGTDKNICASSLLMHAWRHVCVCICMSVLCLRGGCMFCVTFPVWAFSYLLTMNCLWSDATVWHACRKGLVSAVSWLQGPMYPKDKSLSLQMTLTSFVIIMAVSSLHTCVILSDRKLKMSGLSFRW